MKYQQLGTTGLEVSSIILGCMRLGDLPREEIAALVEAALETGVTMVDHADIYGAAPHQCEAAFGDAVDLRGSRRDKLVVQSKVGIRTGFYDFSYGHILASVEDSLRALGTDYLDVLLLHRPDTLMEPDEVAKAFDQLVESGKVRHVGVSNHTPGQMDLLGQSVRQPIIVDQMQIGLAHAAMFAAGLSVNIESSPQSPNRDGQLLEEARLRGITLQAWGPVQGVAGPLVGDHAHYAELNQALDEVAAEHDVTPSAIAVAWITRHPADIQVVVGSTKPHRVQEAAVGSTVELTRQQWYRLFTAAGYTLP